ncbi:MAG: TnpV protein [Clostridiales bacterium]|nr:TnpV protein [Clostridiales bacterium]
MGHYGRLFLENYCPDLYTALVTSEQLYSHCAEIEEAAHNRLDRILPQLAKDAGATEELKIRGL